MRRAGAVLAAAVVAVAGCGAAPADRPVPPPPVGGAPVTAAPVTVAAPARVRIPSIGVDSPVVAVGVDGAGALVPPTETAVTGWYAAGPSPGATGPALLAGHVDARSGPAVFYRLRELAVGARVEVDRADGSTVAFVVTRSFQTPKAAFPTDDVYAPTPAPELRLITCGGTFDPGVGHYRDNVVVEAVLDGGAGWTITR